MTDNALATTLAATVGATAFVVGSMVRLADHRHAVKRLATQSCLHCGHTYGQEVGDVMDTVKYHWMAAPGNSASSLGLPRFTYLVVCSSCLGESEFKENGEPFMHPQFGILHFTRNGRLTAKSNF